MLCGVARGGLCMLFLSAMGLGCVCIVLAVCWVGGNCLSVAKLKLSENFIKVRECGSFCYTPTRSLDVTSPPTPPHTPVCLP